MYFAPRQKYFPLRVAEQRKRFRIEKAASIKTAHTWSDYEI
jgi:hypothetical protein